MARKNYLALEAPDTKATIDFLGQYGVVITAELSTNKDGEPTIHVCVKACDQRGTILGEVLEVIPVADDDPDNDEDAIILGAFEGGPLGTSHPDAEVVHEHDQLWITCQCGAQYSVVETSDGYDFEGVSQGEEDFHDQA